MKYNVSLEKLTTIDHIEGKWTRDDYVQLLDVYEYGDAGDASEKDLKELLFMVITDYEPQEAAAILLKHKLGEELNRGQIEQLSNDMLKENVAERYSDISFHSRLFDINELLYKAYNGKFPLAQASVVTLKIEPVHENDRLIDKSFILKAIAPMIDDRATYKRIFADQLASSDTFEEAADIIWYFKSLDNDRYEIITSIYWINENDFTTNTCVSEVKQ